MGTPRFLLHSSIIIVIITSLLLLHQLDSFRSLMVSYGKVRMAALVPVKIEPKKLRILCWILTGGENHMTRAIHVKRTWGPRCDILLFMSSQQDERLGTVALPGVQEGWDKLWPKTLKAFQYVWEHHRDDADWFMKADDDTWVFVDNLRSLLANYDSNKAHFLGTQGGRTDRNETYHYGGTGYLVSREALRGFIEDSVPYAEKCYPDTRDKFRGWEDAEFGECMLSIGVLPETIVDGRGTSRLLNYNPVQFIVDGQNSSRWEQVLNNSEVSPVTYHKVEPKYMYVLEYMTRNFKQDHNNE